jgi:methionyl-tRNA formyltransferase
MEKILVFGSKLVGAQCIGYLLDQYPADDYTFVVCGPEVEAAVEVLEHHERSFFRLTDSVVEEIGNLPEGHFGWLLNLWGGHIFDERLLRRAHRSLNIHPSYLPIGRGRDPVVWAIRYEQRAGVSLHEIRSGVDEGPIWYQEEVPYHLPIRGADLYATVIERCVEVFREKWPDIRAGRLAAVPQGATDSKTHTRRDLWPDRRIDADSSKNDRELILRLLAHDFAPGYAAQVVLNGERFDATLSLTPAGPEKD